MHILTGQYRGRKIQMPRGIRPTQDKVRKALFDVLGDIQGLSFLELFAGSGAVGFESISNGIAWLVLVEPNRDCQEAIKKTIATLGFKDCILYSLEADKAIKVMRKQSRVFDIIFMDPPYYKNRPPGHGLLEKSSDLGVSFGDSFSKNTLQILSAYDILAPNGFVVVQHSKKDALPETVDNLELFKQKKYGDTILSFYRKVV